MTNILEFIAGLLSVMAILSIWAGVKSWWEWRKDRRK